jgi:hypothetical protein
MSTVSGNRSQVQRRRPCLRSRRCRRQIPSGSAVTREDDDGTMWEGTLDGNVLSLSTSSGDYSEDSVFTFDEAGESFTIASEYTYATCSGTCTGTGERIP